MIVAPEACPLFTGHAMQRAQERYGVTLTGDDMGNILAACLAGEARLLRRYRETMTELFAVTYSGVRFVVAVRRQMMIVTFLPENSVGEDEEVKPHRRPIRRDEARAKPYKRNKFNLADLRRGDFEDIST